MKELFGFVRCDDGVIGLAIVRNDVADVVLSLGVRRNTLVLIDRAFARIVRSEGQTYITVESLQQPREILSTSVNIGSLVIWIFTAKSFRGCRHQLHQALCANWRLRTRVVIRLLFDNRVNEAGINTL